LYEFVGNDGIRRTDGVGLRVIHPSDEPDPLGDDDLSWQYREYSVYSIWFYWECNAEGLPYCIYNGQRYYAETETFTGKGSEKFEVTRWDTTITTPDIPIGPIVPVFFQLTESEDRAMDRANSKAYYTAHGIVMDAVKAAIQKWTKGNTHYDYKLSCHGHFRLGGLLLESHDYVVLKEGELTDYQEENAARNAHKMNRGNPY
jgi:hypothetical protein